MIGAGIMAMVMAVESRKGKKLQDKVFSVGRAAQEAIDLYGEEQVVNATVGCYGDESGTLGCLPLVEKIYRQLPIHDFIAYAPPLGLDAYRQMVIEEVFEAHRPDAYCDAIATAGGTGAIHIAIMNYSEIGDAVLVTDWHWGVYGSLCQEVERKLQTFSLFDAKGAFNIVAFTAGVDSLLEKQDSLLIILNTPAHNPTGYSLSYEEWEQVLEVCRQAEKKGKKISIVVDIAYIAYAGEKNEVRHFMELFSHLPEHLFIMVAFSMSKGYTLYGQRTGALVGISSSRAVVDEFIELGKYSARTAWSNVNRAAMTLLTTVRQDKVLCRQIEVERMQIFQQIMKRAAIFTQEAEQCRLAIIPYQAGFFISVPTTQADVICQRLQQKCIFTLPVTGGIRLGVCSIPERKMKGLAKIMQETIEEI